MKEDTPLEIREFEKIILKQLSLVPILEIVTIAVYPQDLPEKQSNFFMHLLRETNKQNQTNNHKNANQPKKPTKENPQTPHLSYISGFLKLQTPSAKMHQSVVPTGLFSSPKLETQMMGS